MSIEKVWWCNSKCTLERLDRQKMGFFDGEWRQRKNAAKTEPRQNEVCKKIGVGFERDRHVCKWPGI